MKVGDLVEQKISFQGQKHFLGPGIVLSKYIGGMNPKHSCVTVYYAKFGKTYDIAESLVEVISEGG